jgi:hypothetical protein
VKVLGARLARRLLAAMGLLLAASERLRAQQPKIPIAPELRVDVLDGRGTAVQGGAGIQIPMGVYVRLGVIGGLGTRWIDDEARLDGRVDVLTRFLLDPFRQSRWGLSAGAGVSVHATSGENVQPDLLVAVDLEGPRNSHGFSPAFQVGFGGGLRGGIGLRWSGRSTR